MQKATPKRRAPSGDGVKNGEQASGSSKRPRLSSITNEEEQEDVATSHYSESENRLLDRVARMEAEGEQELQNLDEEELTRHEKHRNSQQTEAEVGIIEMIKLENFMCHRHLELKLGPNINFIIGQNGSTFNPHATVFFSPSNGKFNRKLCHLAII